MIKVFTTNKDGKIELTKDELKALLDEAYWDGYRANNHYVYYSPLVNDPYKWTVTDHTITMCTESTKGTVNTGITMNTESVSILSDERERYDELEG